MLYVQRESGNRRQNEKLPCLMPWLVSSILTRYSLRVRKNKKLIIIKNCCGRTNITLPLYAAMNYQQTIGDMKPGKREREEAEEGRKGSAENTVPGGEYMHA